ncbi:MULTISPECIES: universal stress protein [unclassified Streptomyces]|uniref:universal stress protein n=1 Tax=unclassified Streptomyces TaxID=2593676 RepID=UPI0006AF1307|nr:MULTISPECIES: universal stress protein [unclassified Streptomyces]KOX19973.1 Universal stress protein family [Streptomyces sp. NRRL F-6491]KOX41583.1 Universal stress protein family [Streptomyces sp. NRRL F-6492]
MSDTNPAHRPPVVVCVDGSEHGPRVLEWALRTAEGTGSPLVVAHVRSEELRLGTARVQSPGPAPELPDTVLNGVAAGMERRGPRVPVRYASLDGSVTDALAAVARGARLLVTGSRGRGGFASLLLGSTSRTLAASAPCPLVVVPHEARTAVPEDGRGAGRVLLGLHPEETPDEVPAFAFEEARHRGVPLEAVTAFRLPPPQGALLAVPSPALQVPPPLPLANDAEELLREAEREQEERLRPFAARWPDVELRPVVVPGDAAGRLVEGSRDAGLVVVGRHHRHHFGSLLVGSVAHAVLHEAHCPVAVVPPVPAG